MEHALSPDQQKALDGLLSWFAGNKQKKLYITMGGYAGTGKTTLISILRTELNRIDPKLRVSFASYTGKAARVLHAKITEAKSLYPQDTVGTIHSLIYTPVLDENLAIVSWKQKQEIEAQLIIIDEASMVDEMIWYHLASYGIPMIVVGDHGQLPPMAGNFNLMQKPDLILEEIHRQKGQNPIIDLSIAARTQGAIDPGKYSPFVVKYSREDEEAQEALSEMLSSYDVNTMILCGYNTTRKRLNTHIRKSLGFDSPEPVSGDRVICLRNNHTEQIFNGMLGTIISIESRDDSWYMAEILMDGEERKYAGLIYKNQFNALTAYNFTENRKETIKGDLFDFGYALTVHKAQGSQAKRVVLFEERFKKMSDSEWRRWLYTAVTRAEEELYIFPR